MADEPQSRPAPDPTPDRSPKGGPESKPDSKIYGGQWGQSGKQNPDDPAEADPRSTGQPPGA